MALRKPPLREEHADRGAKFTEFGGWDMPVEFDSIREEHAAVREAAGVFDVSHMGEIEVSGPDATALMQRLTTNDVTALSPGGSQYACITDEEGVILDDTIVYRPPAAGDGSGGGDDGEAATDAEYLFIPNAGHDERMHARWTDYRDEFGLDATVTNATDEWAMFAVQGPDAPELVAEAAERVGGDGEERSSSSSRNAERSGDTETPSESLAAETGGSGESVLDLSKFEACEAEIAGARCLLARTGYTGEDGFEVLAPWAEAADVWAAFDCQPCGLGARDTLRIEMGLLLSGQDFDPESEPRNPYEAGVGFTVKLDTEFVGRDALERVSDAGVEEAFVGLRLLDRGVARHGYDVTDGEGHVVGRVTSGTMSPTLGEPVALGYLPVEYTDPGTRVDVVVRGQRKRARVATTPFLEDR